MRHIRGRVHLDNVDSTHGGMGAGRERGTKELTRSEATGPCARATRCESPIKHVDVEVDVDVVDSAGEPIQDGGNVRDGIGTVDLDAVLFAPGSVHR
jgi:hypothetical protein